MVQYDAPREPEVWSGEYDFDLILCSQMYIHRVGRTARGECGKGKALLFLLTQELTFLSCLKVLALT